MSKEKEKELNVDFIGGEELTEKEEAELREFFSKKKKASNKNRDREGTRKRYLSNDKTKR